MAIYHCSISNVSRAKGSSSCATLSYISADKVYEERTAQTYSYGRAERVLATGTLIPENAPEEYRNSSVLFNSIENYEKAENARTAKKIEVALPREFDLAGQKQIVEDYIHENLTKEGYACAYAIHTDKNNNNPHAHILVANRQLTDKGEWSSKRKMEYVLDETGQRVPRLDENGQQKTDKNGRKQWLRVSVEQNPLDKKEFLQKLREGWAVECNKHLEPEQQIDHRSYAAQGIEQIPTVHEGYASREIEARGGISDRAELNRKIREKNNLLKQLIEQVKELGKAVADLLHGRSVRPSKASIKANKAEMTKIRLEILELKDKREDIEVALKSKALLNDNNELIKEYNKCSDKESFAASHPYFYDVINAYRNIKEIAAKWNDGKILSLSGWEQLAIETDQKISSLYLKLSEKQIVDKELQLALDKTDIKRKNLGSPSL